ncbi:MAG: T9SS type A sorting domain-containing protein [Bacteroidales bacterium]|jgi:photosystem II stability/assembly factor-like uncharacterized protein|nr:T9SS type A sorting domain-containing protein [Bacteroidales bacterium]
MKKLIIILSLAFITLCANAQPTWQILPSPVTHPNGHPYQGYDTYSIALTGYNSLLISSGRGDIYKKGVLDEEWALVYTSGYHGSGHHPLSLTMFGTDFGYAFKAGLLLTTTDGGDTWHPFDIPNISSITQFKPVDENNFYFSSNQVIYKYAAGTMTEVFNINQWNVANAQSKSILKWDASNRYAYVQGQATLDPYNSQFQVFSIDFSNEGTVIELPVETFTFIMSMFAMEEGADILIGLEGNGSVIILSSQDGFQTHHTSILTPPNNGTGMIGIDGGGITRLANGEIIVCGQHPTGSLAQVMIGSVMMSNDNGLTWQHEQRYFGDQPLGEIQNIYYSDIASYDNTCFLASNVGILYLPATIIPQDDEDGCDYCNEDEGEGDEVVIEGEGEEIGEGDEVVVGEKGAEDATGILDIGGDSFKLYPNPAGHTLSIQSEATILGINICNTMGMPVQTVSNISSTIYNADLNNLPNGSYFMKITTTEGVINRKIIVSK